MDFKIPWTDTCSKVGLACRNGNNKLLQYLLQDGSAVDVGDNQGWRPIHDAAAYNSADCLKLLLEHGKSDINWKSFEGETPLMLAVQRAHEEIVQLLMSNGADPNIWNNEKESPLMIATTLENLNCIRTLLDGGADVNLHGYDGSTALHLAIVGNSSNTSVVEELAARGAQMDAQDDCGITPVFQAAQVGFLAGLKVLVKHAKETGRLQSIIDLPAEDGATPTIIAAQNGFDDCVKYLLENGADCNKLTTDHVSALHLAIQFGHSTCAHMLLDRMDQSSWLPYTNEAFTCVIGSPLHAAIFWKRYDILKRILSTGIDTNAVFGHLANYLRRGLLFSNLNIVLDNEIHKYLPKLISPLGVATLTESIPAMIDLLEAGAEINPKSDMVMCPLFIALFTGREAIVKLLLSKGADPNCSGKSARKIFPRLLILPVLNAQLVRLLLSYGADATIAISRPCPCLKNHLMDCGANDVLVKAYHDRFHRTAAVLQEFLNPVELREYVHRVFTIEKNIYTEDLHFWQKVIQATEIPTSLANLCRIKIRKLVMDNGSKEFPIKKRLEKLTHLPVIIDRYLSHE